MWRDLSLGQALGVDIKNTCYSACEPSLVTVQGEIECCSDVLHLAECLQHGPMLSSGRQDGGHFSYLRQTE
jgi:hypothetical protein